MIDSALGLDPKDESQAAKGKRVIQGLKQLDGIVFAARIMVEPASSAQYKDANKLANVVLPGEPQYASVMRGEAVPPEPVNAKPRKAPEAAAQQAPAWGAPSRAGRRRRAVGEPGRTEPAPGRSRDRSGLAQHLKAGRGPQHMTDDEWQAHVTREAAKAIGEWLEGRGRLHQPIRCLTMPELEAMAQNAISSFIVLASRRMAEKPEEPGSRKLSMLLG